MTFAKPAAAAILLLLGLAPAAGAQSANTGRPAEAPPAAYDGAEYVDSRGCAFVRAQVDGAVTWVPRVTRARAPVCGMAPTVTAGASVAPPPAPAVEEIPVDPDPTAARRVAARVEPVPVPSAPVRRASRTRPVDAGSTGRSFAAAGSDSRAAPVTVIVRRLGKPVPSTAYPGGTRVVPLHVAQRRARVGAFTVPRGYRAAWEDDRLNPHRAEGTLAGRDAMNAIWTTTVPRRLIDPSRAGDRAPKPAVVYPIVVEHRRVSGTQTLATRGAERTPVSGRGQGAGAGR